MGTEEAWKSPRIFVPLPEKREEVARAREKGKDAKMVAACSVVTSGKAWTAGESTSSNSSDP